VPVGTKGDRLLSGHARLDQVLGGGLPMNAITLIMGLPGSGKTILAQQYAFHNASRERPSLYLSTVSEPFEKILRYGQALSFFDPTTVGESILYEDLGTILQEGGLPAVFERVSVLIKERRPGIIVLDSFKALGAYAQNPEAFRRFLHDLAARLSVFPASSFWVGEYDEREISEAPEFAVADAIIQLGTVRTGDREGRVLQVLKLRGSAFAPGRHAYRLSAAGIDVFPRLADPRDSSSYILDTGKQSSGIDALDQMLADGYWPGASTLCAGPSGAGQTLMGVHFIFHGAEQGEPGVIATLQENPTQLERIVNGFGWTLDQQNVEVMYRSPVDVYIDEWVYELLEAIERVEARRVLIDSLADLQFASRDEIRFREFMYSVIQRCSRQGVSLFMTTELPELFRVDRLSEFGVSHLSDNVVVLQYIRNESLVERALTVMKTRASRHEPEIRRFNITPQGILLGEKFNPDQEFA
jgi:circadian clock protein KaiC